jgi:hypothetical protein
MCDDKHMLKVVQHAPASALNNQEAIATFLLLLNWMENSTNAFQKTCTENKDICTILGNIEISLKNKVRYMPLLYQQSKTLPFPGAICMGYVHLSSLEQICQGATYYKQLILVRVDTFPTQQAEKAQKQH